MFIKLCVLFIRQDIKFVHPAFSIIIPGVSLATLLNLNSCLQVFKFCVVGQLLQVVIHALPICITIFSR